MTDKSLPQAQDAERSLLGAMLLGGAPVVATVRATVSPEHFTLGSHRALFKLLVAMTTRGESVDMLVLHDKLKRMKKLDEVGGSAYLAQLTDGVVYTKESIESRANLVRDTARHRATIILLERAAAQAMDGINVNEVIGSLQNGLLKIVSADRNRSADLFEVASNLFNRALRIKAGDLGLPGLTTTISDLDELTGGIRPAEYIVLGGRTSQGKSSLLRQILLENAKRKKKVALYNYEMTVENTIECLIALESGIDFDRVRDPRFLRDDEVEMYAAAAKTISELQPYLVIVDCAGMSRDDLAARMRADAMNGISLGGLDYLQLVNSSEKEIRLRVGSVSAMCREFVNTTKVPLIALSQIRRPFDGNENREPVVYDLKETGDIENDAYQVWLIYRPKDKDVNGRKFYTGEDWLIVPKNRNGSIDNIPVVFKGPQLVFKDRTISKPFTATPVTPPDRFTPGEQLEMEHD